MTPQKLINPKALSAVIRDFFGRSQLSPVHGSDQSAGRADAQAASVRARARAACRRDRAGFEVRDVHPSHYGRICPIETPEGPNIGLIASLATFARINDFGFIETPYRKVENGRVTDHVDYLTADREETLRHRPGQRAARRQGPLHDATVSVCRCKGDFIDVRAGARRLHGRVAEAAGVAWRPA